MEEQSNILEYNFEKYLEERYFYNNLENDFSNNNYFEFKQDETHKEFYSFNLESKTYKFLKSFDEDTAGKIGANKYSIITLLDIKNNTILQRYGICFEVNKNILILPYFQNIKFYKEFNVFICYNYSVNASASKGFIYDLYYFDIKGRYIKKEEGYNSNIPNIAVINNDIIPVKNTLLTIVSKIYRYNLIEVFQYDDDKYEELYQLMDNLGNPILDKNYKKIVVSLFENAVFAEDDNNIVRFDLDGKNKKVFQFQEIIYYDDEHLKIVDTENNKKKYGIINYKGEIIIHPKYDYIVKCKLNEYYIFFKGKYEFDLNVSEDDQKLIESKLEEDFGNVFFVNGKLEGKWGLIDKDEKVILNPEYEWIEEIDKNLFFINQRGNAYEYDEQIERSSYSDRYGVDFIENQKLVAGGDWMVFSSKKDTLQNIKIIDMNKFYNKHIDYSSFEMSAYILDI